MAAVSTSMCCCYNSLLFCFLIKCVSTNSGQMQKWMFDQENTYAGFHTSGKTHITDMNQKHATRFLGQRKYSSVKDKPFALFVNFFAPHHWVRLDSSYILE